MTYDVVIAGGGPVGLFLACELALREISTLVLERMEKPDSPLKAGWMGMRGLNLPSVEAFYRRGMLDEGRRSSLALTSVEDPSIKLENAPGAERRFAGHFAGMMLNAGKIDFSSYEYLVAGPAAIGGMVSLEEIEERLAERAKVVGVEIRRGTPVTGIAEAGDGVTVYAGAESFQAKWLVGSDGGRSTVRKAAGFEFPGTEPEFTGYTASVELSDPEKLQPGFHLTQAGMYHIPGLGLGSGSNRIGIIDFDGGSHDRDQEITIESLQAVLRRVSATDVTLKAMHVASTFTDRARQATTYRKGRVLLAGDAAHIHSPLGGQGLNTGLGDAVNLGWKLAATIEGWAPDGLLDTYTSERHPVGAWALDWTRAQVAIMRPDPHARAISSVVRDLIETRDGTSYFAEKISGVMLRYDLPGDHPLIGRSAPDLEFEDGTRLGNLLHDGTGLLLNLSGGNGLELLGRKWPGRVKYVEATSKDEMGLAAILVRPDGFVAWAADERSTPDLPALQETMRRWFGEPQETPDMRYGQG